MALRTGCQRQIRSLRGQKLGVAEQLAGGTKGAASPSIRQMGLRGDQAKCPFLPLLSPWPPSAPIALPRQQLGKGQAPRKPLISF